MNNYRDIIIRPIITEKSMRYMVAFQIYSKETVKKQVFQLNDDCTLSFRECFFYCKIRKENVNGG